MWGSLLAAVIVLLLFAYGPAFLMLRGLGMRRSRAIASAPLISIVVYSLLAVAYERIGIESSWISLVVPFTVLGGIFFAIGASRRASQRKLEGRQLAYGRMKRPLRSFAAYLVAGVCAVMCLFAIPLGSADAFICGFDIAHHMSTVRSFVESGNWSMLDVTLFPGEPGTYYPSANSLLAALAVSCLDVPVTLALNAVNIVIAGFIFPLGVWLVMVRIFGWGDARTFIGAFCSVIFMAFPWEMFTRSAPVLYAYVLGLSLLPAFMALLMDCFETSAAKHRDSQSRGMGGQVLHTVSRFAAAFLALVAIALAHPSAFFSAAVFIIGYIVHVIIVRTRSMPVGKRVLFVCVWLAMCAALWVFLYKAPFMQAVVTCEYSEKCGFIMGIARIVLVWAPHVGAQYVLGAVVLVGLVGCLLDARRRWLLLPYVLAAVLTLGCLIVPPGPLRFLMSGFWYNHVTRLTATLAIFAMPIAAQGFGLIMHLVGRAAHSAYAAKSAWPRRLGASFAGIVVTAFILVVIIFVQFPLPRATAAAEFAGVMQRQNDPAYKTSYLDQDERDFLQKALEATSDGGRVLNVPHDGSAYAYGYCGLNTTGRTPAVYHDEDLVLLADKIDRIATDDEVARTAEKLGVEYVLMLDIPHKKGSTYYGSFDETYWKGVYGIEDDTPGFEVVLSDGNMRLYRII